MIQHQWYKDPEAWIRNSCITLLFNETSRGIQNENLNSQNGFGDG